MFADLALALRTWLKSPRLTLTLLACIAVSIGGTATVLTFVHALLIRPLPYPEQERLVFLEPEDPARSLGRRAYLSYPNFVDLRASATSLEKLEAATVSRLVMQTPLGSERLRGETVTPGYFDLFGIRPAIGRAFTAEEFAGSGERAILISSRLWRTHFGADPALVGTPVSTRVGPAVVVGIMPAGFIGIGEEEGTDYWFAEGQNNHPAMLTDRSILGSLVVGRLANGATLAGADAELGTLVAGLREAHPDINKALAARLLPFGENWRALLRPGLLAMLVGSLFLLVIGCGNVAILLLARLVTRERELAVRLSIGASRGALLRMMFAESLVIALAGGAAGLLLSQWLNAFFVRMAGAALPPHLPVETGAVPLAICATVVLLTGFGFGLLPALVATRVDPAVALRTGGRGLASGALQGIGGRLLVVGQTALAVALLAGAALFLRSYDKLRNTDFGYRTDSLLRYQVTLQRDRYTAPGALAAFHDGLASELRALPGVKQVAYLGPTLPPYDSEAVDIRMKGAEFPTPNGALGINQHYATNEAFEILRVPLLEGRWFGPEDRAGGQAVGLVSETLARRIAPEDSAVGRIILFNETTEVVIVGVVADARWNGQRDRNPSGLNLFLSNAQFPQSSIGVLFDCTVEPRSLIDPVRKAVLARDGTAALHWITTMEQALDDQTVNERFWSVLAGTYAATAFLLATLGLYGVLTHGVASRIREIGIRMALGSTSAGIGRLVVAQGLSLVGSGLAAGIALTLLAGRMIESRLYGISFRDPLALTAVGLLLLVAAAIICWLPASRAARVNPVEALRAE